MRRPSFTAVRDTILLAAGLSIVGYETVIAAEPRLILIGIAAAMIGLPATFFADRRFTSSAPSDTEDTP